MNQNIQPRWLSETPGKAWGEKFFLIYSPIWMAMMGVSIVFGLPEKLNNTGMLIMEKRNESWSAGKTAVAAFASNAITLLLFDVAT